MHLAAAAGQLLEHLAAIEGTILPDQGNLAVLARAGAQLLVSGIELDGPPPRRLAALGARCPRCRRPYRPYLMEVLAGPGLG